MKRTLWLLAMLVALCLPARALDLPDGLDGAVPQELLDTAQEEGDLISRGAAYLWGCLTNALHTALAGSVRAAVLLMLLALLCGLIEGTAEPAGDMADTRAFWARPLWRRAICTRLSGWELKRWTNCP